MYIYICNDLNNLKHILVLDSNPKLKRAFKKELSNFRETSTSKNESHQLRITFKKYSELIKKRG